ncbi:MAG: hypothetical protein AAF902_05675 [Chloroflexota bacterium]
MSNKTFRQSVRILHILEAFVLGAFIYGPWGDGSILEATIQYFFFPALGISGIMLWQQHRLMKIFRRSRAA